MSDSSIDYLLQSTHGDNENDICGEKQRERTRR